MSNKDKKEDKKAEQGEPTSASEEKNTNEFVTIKGKKFKANQEGKPLLTDDGEPIPFKKGDKVDYKADLEKAQDRLEKEKERNKKAGYKIEQLKKEKSSIDEDKINKLIEQRTQQVKNEILNKVSEKEAKDMAYSLSENPDEAKLTLFHYKHTINKSGELAEDMKNAIALANRDSLSKKFEEANRGLSSKKNRGKGTIPGTGGQQSKPSNSRPKLSSEDEKLVRIANLSWDKKEGKWRGRSGKLYENIPKGEGSRIVEGRGATPIKR